MSERGVDRGARGGRGRGHRQAQLGRKIGAEPVEGVFRRAGRCVGEQSDVERIKPVLERQRVVPASFAQGLLEIGAQSRRDVGADRDTPDPAHRGETERGLVIPAELDEFLPAGEALGGDSAKVAGGVLDPDHRGQPRHFGERLDADVGDGTPGDIIDDDREVGFGHQRVEMRDQPGLARPVVIRKHDQRRVGAGVLCRLHVLDHGRGRVAAAAGDHRDPPARLVDRGAEQGILFVELERRDFAGGPARHHRGRALVDLPVDEVSE